MSLTTSILPTITRTLSHIKSRPLWTFWSCEPAIIFKNYKDCLTPKSFCRHYWHQQVMDSWVILENLSLGGLNLSLLVQNLLLYLMDLIVNGKQSLFSQSGLVLSFRLRSIVLLSPTCKLTIHGINIVIDKLNWFAKRSGVLTNALDHALDKL